MVKTKLTIKKVKGHRYLQLTDIHGNLIHIGNAENTDNWITGIQALIYQYDALSYQEALKLDPEKAKEAIKEISNVKYQEGPTFDKFSKKRIKARLRQKFTWRAIEYDIRPTEDPNLPQEVDEEKKRLEHIDEQARRIGVSPDLYEIYFMEKNSSRQKKIREPGSSARIHGPTLEPPQYQTSFVRAYQLYFASPQARCSSRLRV